MTEDEKRKKRRLLFRNLAIGCTVTLTISVVAIVIFINVVLIPAFDGIGEIFDSPVCEPSNPEGIQSVARIKLPPSYSNLWSTCGGLQGWWAEAHFDIDPDELNIFLETTDIQRIEPLTTQPDRIYASQLKEIEPLSSLRYGLSDEPEWLEEVIVDTSNPDRWTVYFTLLAG